MTALRRTAWILLLVVSSTGGARAADDPALPTFDLVESAVEGYFKGGQESSPHRLLARTDVEPVFVLLEKIGWRVAGAKEVTARFLTDDDALVRELRRPQSAEFAKRISTSPDVYDRLDRLRGMPYGLRRIREFATTKGGEQMLKYMTTTKGGANLNQQISRGQGGGNFDKPTGKLYTRADLVKALKAEYDAEVARRAKGAGVRTTRTTTPRAALTRFPTSRVGFARQ